jgi:hypothetical protein
MAVRAPDIRQTLEYRLRVPIIEGVPTALTFCLLALFALAVDDEPPPQIVFTSGVIMAAGAGLVLLGIWRRLYSGEPRFVLSPAGVFFRMSRLKRVLIPWREIQAVDTMDIVTKNRATRYSSLAPKLRFRDVTVVLVSKQFYDAHIYIDSLFGRGFFWNMFFIPKGSLIQVVLNPEPVSADPRALFDAVETRWRAFRDQPAAVRSAVGGNTAAPGGVAATVTLPKVSAWDMAKVAALLICLAGVLTNLLHVWAAPGQIAARAERKKWADEKRAWQEEQARFQEEQKQREENLRKLLNRF